MIHRLLAVGLLASLSGNPSTVFAYQAEQPIHGHWEGAITEPAGELPMMVDFVAEGDSLTGTFDLPAAAVFHWPLTIITTPLP